MLSAGQTNSDPASILSLLLLLAGAVLALGGAYWWNKRRQAKKAEEAAALEAYLEPRLGATFEPLDTAWIGNLPFVAFQTWPNAGRLVENVATFPSPLGTTISAFEYTWSRAGRDVFGNERQPLTSGHYQPPDKYPCVGSLTELPIAMPPLFISSFPDRGKANLVMGTSQLLPLVEIPPGLDVVQSFGIRFRADGDPAWLQWLLTPAVMDGLLRGPPGLHVEVLDRKMLAMAYLPFLKLGPVDGIVAIADWTRWFLTLLPPMQPAATPASTPA